VGGHVHEERQSRGSPCRKHASARFRRGVDALDRQTGCSCSSASVTVELSTPHASDSSINRYYDPTTGQFLSVDPLVSQTQQPYIYASDDSVNNTDPTGDSSRPYCAEVKTTIFQTSATSTSGCGGPPESCWDNQRQDELHIMICLYPVNLTQLQASVDFPALSLSHVSAYFKVHQFDSQVDLGTPCPYSVGIGGSTTCVSNDLNTALRSAPVDWTVTVWTDIIPDTAGRLCVGDIHQFPDTPVKFQISTKLT